VKARRIIERDDLESGKVNIPGVAKSYARMNSSAIMDQPGGTAKKWNQSLKLRKAITNQSGIKDFKSMDKGQKTGGGKVESLSAQQLVDRMLDF
jgi:hypothetical protein